SKPAKLMPGEPRPPYQPYGKTTANAVRLFLVTLWDFISEHPEIINGVIDLGNRMCPAKDVKKVKHKGGKHVPVPEHVIRLYLDRDPSKGIAPATKRERDGMIVALYTGQRESDMVTMNWDYANDTHITVVRIDASGNFVKGSKKTKTPTRVKILPPLRAVL